MRSPLDFLVKLRYLLLFLALEAVCMILLHRHATMRDNVMFTSAGTVSGFVNEISSTISSYFGLRKENDRLSAEIATLRSQLYELRDSAEIAGLPAVSDGFVVARVINNTLNRQQNYITIDKGSKDGISEGMGVCGLEGVVGVIYKVSSGYALIIPLLNRNSHVSCKVTGQDTFGFISWNGGDPHIAKLTDLPTRSGVAVGDTVLTSGFSSIFPKGLWIGTVCSVNDDETGNPEVFVELATDFSRLNYVYVNTMTVPEDLSELSDR